MHKFLVVLLLGAGIPAPDGGSRMIVSTGVSKGDWKLMPDCAADGGNALNFTASSNSFACGAVQAQRTLSVSTATVGNVGGGEDDLTTYSLPANTLSADGQGVSIVAFGTTANNGNAKTLNCYFGSTLLFSHGMDTGFSQNWRVSAVVLRTGAATQLGNTVFAGTNTNSDAAATAPSATLSSAVTIKCTAQGTSDNDLIQYGMIVELL